MLARRTFLQTPLIAGVAARIQADAANKGYPIIDAHGHMGTLDIYGPRLSATGPELESACESYGIKTICASHIAALLHDPERGNREVIQAERTHPGRIIASVTFPAPWHPGALQMLEDYRRQGVRIFGEIKFDKLNEPAALALLRKATELGMIVLAHADAEDVVAVARQIPAMRILIAHVNTGVSVSPYAWRAGIELARRQPNIYFETSTSVIERGMIEETVRTLGAERVIFGSDFPLLDIPVMLAKIEDADIGETDRKLILGGNMARLLSIPA